MLPITQELIHDLQRALQIGCDEFVDSNTVMQFFADLQSVTLAQETGKPAPAVNLSGLDANRSLIDFAIARFQETINAQKGALERQFFHETLGVMIEEPDPAPEGHSLHIDLSGDTIDLVYVQDDEPKPPKINSCLHATVDPQSDELNFSSQSTEELAGQAIARLKMFRDSIPDMKEITLHPEIEIGSLEAG